MEGNSLSPPPDRHQAKDALDAIYSDGTATVYELAIMLSNGIRGTLVLRCDDTNGYVRIDGPAARYILHKKDSA